MKKIFLYDTTLRDGTQRENLSLSVNDKVSIARRLDAFGIPHLARVPGRFLSAGQKRRVALGRLLGAPAPLWLLDEPATSLDAAAEASLVAAIGRHREGGGRVVVCSHGDLPLDGATGIALERFQPGGGAP